MAAPHTPPHAILPFGFEPLQSNTRITPAMVQASIINNNNVPPEDPHCSAYHRGLIEHLFPGTHFRHPDVLPFESCPVHSQDFIRKYNHVQKKRHTTRNCCSIFPVIPVPYHITFIQKILNRIANLGTLYYDVHEYESTFMKDNAFRNITFSHKHIMYKMASNMITMIANSPEYEDSARLYMRATSRENGYEFFYQLMAKELAHNYGLTPATMKLRKSHLHAFMKGRISNFSMLKATRKMVVCITLALDDIPILPRSKYERKLTRDIERGIEEQMKVIEEQSAE